jgi:hypothetical protein
MQQFDARAVMAARIAQECPADDPGQARRERASAPATRPASAEAAAERAASPDLTTRAHEQQH